MNNIYNVAKNFDILATVCAFYIIVLIVQQNYFFDLLKF